MYGTILSNVVTVKIKERYFYLKIANLQTFECLRDKSCHSAKTTFICIA